MGDGTGARGGRIPTPTLFRSDGEEVPEPWRGLPATPSLCRGPSCLGAWGQPTGLSASLHEPRVGPEQRIVRQGLSPWSLGGRLDAHLSWVGMLVAREARWEGTSVSCGPVNGGQGTHMRPGCLKGEGATSTTLLGATGHTLCNVEAAGAQGRGFGALVSHVASGR